MSETTDRERAASTDERLEREDRPPLSQDGGNPAAEDPGTEPRGNGDLDGEALSRSREVLAGVLGR
jgi:hypothetical protein